MYINTTKRFKYVWFVLFYITFIFIAIIYSCQVVENLTSGKTWQDVASYDFKLVDQTYDDGVLTNIYGISTPEQLAGMFMIDESTERNLNNSSLVYADTMDNIGESDEVITINSEYILLNDVNMSGRSWTPSDFKYIFNGNYHVISNLSFSKSYQYLGMVTTLTGTIKNLTLESVVITNNYSSSTESGTGAIAGRNQGTISNVSVTSGTIQGPSYSSNSYRMVGGITGSNYNGEIFNCVNYASVDRAKFAGGIAGNSYGGSIKNCVNYGSIQCGRNNQARAGGIVGREGSSETSQSKTTLKLCVNHGNVYMGTTGNYPGNVLKASEVILGGIVGTAYDTIDQCANYGVVSCGQFNVAGQNYYHTKVYTGGIAGYSKSNITNCYNTAYITAEAETKSNTITYDADEFDNITVHDHYYGGREETTFSREITKEDDEKYNKESYAYSGGIAGYCNTSIKNCYNTGKIEGGKYEISIVINEKFVFSQWEWFETRTLARAPLIIIDINQRTYYQPICPTNVTTSNVYYLNKSSYDYYCSGNIYLSCAIMFAGSGYGHISADISQYNPVDESVKDLAGQSFTYKIYFRGATPDQTISGTTSITNSGNKYTITHKVNLEQNFWNKDSECKAVNDSTGLKYTMDYSGSNLSLTLYGSEVSDASELPVFDTTIWAQSDSINDGYPYLKNLYW